MKRLALLLALLVSVAAMAADDWQTKCESEGGCLLITQRALGAMVGEIERLQRAIIAMRKEQCA